MPDQDTSATPPVSFKDAAQRSQKAGIADESAAYENAIENYAPASVDEADPQTANDAGGTSETD